NISYSIKGRSNFPKERFVDRQTLRLNARASLRARKYTRISRPRYGLEQRQRLQPFSQSQKTACKQRAMAGLPRRPFNLQALDELEHGVDLALRVAPEGAAEQHDAEKHEEEPILRVE